ncbi:MAG TPA: hypothetical protein VN706_11070 [Gemmatimonadaceae bacterium]|nr:hypothetical protein [Gemmatimonadaceae bacterium]
MKILSAAIVVVLAVAAGVSCSDPVTVCGGVEVIGLTIPDTTTIKMGASTLAIAGDDYGTCSPRPARDFIWSVSDSTVVSVTPLDSVIASIHALRPGHAAITPRYRASGIPVPSVGVTVVP